MCVKNILLEYLRKNEFSGLYAENADCGCGTDDDFIACGSDFSGCKPGYRIEDVTGEYRYKIVSKRYLAVELLYRDAHNYKTHFEHKIDLTEYPEAVKLKEGEDVGMGAYGTLDETEFFGSEIHSYAYDGEVDHNLLEVLTIKSI